jgi:hypothetical protein
MQALIVNLLMKAIRHGLTIYGGAEVLSDDQSKQLAGALSILAGVGWSVGQAILEHRKTAGE